MAQTVATLSHRRAEMLTVIDTQLDWLPMHPELQVGRLFRGIPYLGHPAYHRPHLTSEGLRAQSKILDCFPLPWRPMLDNLLTLIPSRANQWETLRNLASQILPLPRRWIKKQSLPALEGLFGGRWALLSFISSVLYFSKNSSSKLDLVEDI